MALRVTDAELAALTGDALLEPQASSPRGANAESVLQSAIIEALQYAGCFVVRLNAGAMRIGSRLVRLAPAGTPDLLVVVPGGRIVFVEVKTPAGRLSPAQRSAHAELTRLGATVVVVRSVDDALDLL